MQILVEWIQVPTAHGGLLVSSQVVPSPLEEASSRLGVGVSSFQGKDVSSHNPPGMGASSRRGVGVSNLGVAANRRDDDPSQVVAGPSVPSRVEDAYASSVPTLRVGLAPSLQAAEDPTLQVEVVPNLRAAEGPTPRAAEAIHQAEGGPSLLVAADPSP